MALLHDDNATPLPHDMEAVDSGLEDQVGPASSATAELGAPVENTDPLGRHVTLFAAIMLDVGQITGSGIFSVPGTILNSVGSIGVSLLYWIIAPLFAFSGLSLYSELASMFPKRSGAEVVYLEQAYPKPKYFVSTTFAITTILMSFSAANAVVFAQYWLTALDLPITSASQTHTAIGVSLVSLSLVAISTKWSLQAVKFLSSFKIISLAFVVLTGLAVLLGLTNIKDPYANFRHPFEGTSLSVNAFALTLVKANHSFIGWQNAFNVLGEIKSRDPARTARKAGRIALGLTAFLFFFINVSYIAAVPKEEIKNSGQLVAALFFQHVYGYRWGVKILSYLVALNCFGNLVAVTISHARLIREVARQGLLPFPGLFSSTKPFGTPLGPVILKGAISIFVILLVPAKDAFNFVLDLASYPSYLFQCIMIAGIWLLRKRRKLAGIAPSPLQAKRSSVLLYLSLCLVMVVMPWVPPKSGHGDVSFWYATYCVAAIFVLLTTALYYWIWIILLPRLGGYEIVEILEGSEDGSRNKRLVRRYKNAELQSLLSSTVTT
ncbi:amino acid transporter [Macrolepiota fuliginosa MF-IS2]|uniref:Amino acid transporter n=1 Tax=Macrolepiota fuliginosa MF-IS2 TaxID=1400762 RepID=A0A9P5XIF1_9AGAR|nr:amino acid transporter [Macrolepiota fuliginosa MF-IS2]